MTEVAANDRAQDTDLADEDFVDFDGAPVVAAVLFIVGDGTEASHASGAAATALHAPPELDVSTRAVVAGPGPFRNRAIDRERGTYIAVVETGATPAPEWFVAAIAALRDDPTLGIVAAGGSAGDDPGGWLVDMDARAFVMRRTAWTAMGGFDETLGTAARGLDFAWRCWLHGWRVRAIADAVVDFTPLDDASTDELTRIAARSLRDPGRLAQAKRSWRAPMSPFARKAIQRHRRRHDGEIGALLVRAIARGGVAAPLDAILRSAGADRPLGARRRIVVATADTLAPRMAGPGIRALRIATALSSEHDVTLVTTGACSLPPTTFSIEAVEHDRFHELVTEADIVIFQGWTLAGRPWLVQSDVTIVADIYDPMHLEQLEQGREAPAEGGRWLAIAGANEVLNQQLRRGDFFLAASQKQRDLWLGQMAAVGRVNQVLYDEDNSLTERLRIVPFGIEDTAPEQGISAIRGVVPGIGADDDVILWGGGIYNWFDPLTLIEAVDRLRVSRPNIRLYFLGTRHPNPEIPEMRMAVQARRLADDLGIAGSHVFFNEGWVAFESRADYLLDADVAVSIHQQHIETEFSFRTRLLDYLWCSLPIVATGGDSFAPIIEANEIGIVVPPGDVAAVAAALDELLGDDERRKTCAANAAALADAMRWNVVLEPLLDICRNPVRAPDAACPETATTFGVTGPPPAWREDLELAKRYLSEGGVKMVVRRLKSRVDRLRSQA